MSEKPRDIVERTFQFARAIVLLCLDCETRNGMARTLGKQLLRSGTSIGANVEEAQSGQSRPDFISKYSIALKEARETHYWLRLLLASDQCASEFASPLCQEADEIKRILAAIIVKAKQNLASE